MSSTLVFDREAREKLNAGVEKLANAVKITLGPMGKTVAICRQGEVPHLTKDGVTVANAVHLADPYENAGASLVREAAQRSAAVAGDGTTTSTVLAHEMIQLGDKLIASGHSAVEVIEGMRAAARDVVEDLEKSKVKILPERLVDVATISANGDSHAGKIISDAILRVGPDGAVSVQDAKGYDTSLTIVDGTYVDKGYESPYFVTDAAKQIAELDQPDILIVNEEITTMAPLVPVLERIAASGGSLLIVCNGISGEAMQALVLNRVKGGLKVCAIKSPEFAHARVTALQDLAALTGAKVLTDLTQKINASDLSGILGSVKKATVTNRTTLLFGTQQSEDVKQRQASARSAASDPSVSPDDKKIAERRLRRLSDGIAVIQVGGATEAEMQERRDRIDDALHAAKAALRDGVQPGGGVSLARAKKRVERKYSAKDSFGAGAVAFLQSLESPLRQIATNCGVSADLVVQKVRRAPDGHGYDGRNNVYGDMFSLGILDPHAVVVSSIEHSLSVVCNLLSIGVIITEDGQNQGGMDMSFFDNV